MSENTKVYVAGHRGMVGSAICRLLSKDPSIELITRTRAELDLTNQAAVRGFFETTRIDQVYLAAAKVGGIHANNTYPAEFIYENLMIEANVINSAFKSGVKKLLFLGSSCIYPKFAEQPMVEEALLTGSLEPTNEPYAIAKIAGIKLCESYNRQYAESHGIDYRSVMPTNLYGPGDNYHLEGSHVIPALIRKMHDAKVARAPKVVLWGTGEALREFLYVDDLASACELLMRVDGSKLRAVCQPCTTHVNVGSGDEISIKELACIIQSTVHYEGNIVFNTSMPDGTPRKLMDSKRFQSLGWRAVTDLKVGLQKAYSDFLQRGN